MKTLLSDPLLTAGRAICLFLMGLFALVGAICLIAIPVLLFKREEALADLVANGIEPSIFWMIPVLLIAVAGVLSLGFLFVRHMKRIIDSVGEGDPFVPENAGRLTAMAWLMLAIQIAAIPILAVGIYIAESVEDPAAKVETNFNANGLVLVIMLFLLARVFRKGTEMRQDLEGTV